jgi:SAM-dependent methyltransferase
MRNIFPPFSFGVISRHVRSREINVLDVGCGNHMPSITKRSFPSWHYFGLDREDYNIDDHDKAVMDGYYSADLTTDALSAVPDGFFDLIIMAHVIEHLPNGLDVLSRLIPKLKAGGRIYIEYPSYRSLSLPSMPGTLQFCDDPTHVRVYSVQEISNHLLSQGMRIIRATVRRQWRRIILMPLAVPVRLLLRRTLAAGDFWDIAGFAEYVYAEKKEPAA